MTFEVKETVVIRQNRLWLVLSCLLLAAFYQSCKEKNVPYIIVEDEIARLINESYEGTGLFRADHIINPDLYSIPGDTSHYRDSVIEHQRGIKVFISKNSADYRNFGMLREAIAVVTDSFAFQRKRSGTITDTSELKLIRYGFLLRFGDDSDPYLGWKIWGFNGLGTTDPPTTFRIADPNGTPLQFDRSFYTTSPESLRLDDNLRFQLINDIRNLAPASKLSLDVRNARSSDSSHYFLLYSCESDRGFRTRNLIKLSAPNHYVDTLQIPSHIDNRWNIIYAQLHSDDSTRRVLRAWVVPYQMQ